MRRLIFIIIIFLNIFRMIIADEYVIADTDTGKNILLKENGIWEYIDQQHWWTKAMKTINIENISIIGIDKPGSYANNNKVNEDTGPNGNRTNSGMTKNDKYDIFKDFLLIFLAAAAVIIAAIGYAAYRIVEKSIEKRVDKHINETHLKSVANTLTNTGYICWNYYEVEPDPKKSIPFLRKAVKFTNSAYNKIVTLDKKNIENEKAMCRIKNNFAYYLAECCRKRISVLGKNVRENAILAMDLAEEIRSKISTFPDYTIQWLDTYKFVQRYCEKYYKDCNSL